MRFEPEMMLKLVYNGFRTTQVNMLFMKIVDSYLYKLCTSHLHPRRPRVVNSGGTAGLKSQALTSIEYRSPGDVVGFYFSANTRSH